VPSFWGWLVGRCSLPEDSPGVPGSPAGDGSLGGDGKLGGEGSSDGAGDDGWPAGEGDVGKPDDGLDGLCCDGVFGLGMF
jgi:hypothetical protein